MENKKSSISNIYQLDGRVPVEKAIPFGLQHILAMFVGNLAPITMIAAAAQPSLTQAQIALLLQNAMFVAVLCTVAADYGYHDDFGSAQNLILGTITLAVCLLWNILAKGYLKQLSVLVQ